MRTISIAVLALALVACQEIPFTKESRCAEAMSPHLKDPDSIEVIYLQSTGEEGIYHMRYSATNTFNARVSGMARCSMGNGWTIARPIP